MTAPLAGSLDASILIVDDQEANVKLLERLLGEAGYTNVSSTMNPTEVAASHRARPYDLILLALLMPEMDGFEVMQRLNEDAVGSYLPVIVLTAQPAHKLRALQAGARDFISKPFDLIEVKTRIQNMLEVRLLYKRLESYNEELEQTVRERTAELRESELRFRRLTELASDWYWEAKRNRKLHSGFRPGVRDDRDRHVRISRRQQRRASDRLERVGEKGLAGQDRRPRAVSRFLVQSCQCRWRPTDLSRQRRADVQRVLPVHRLPRNRHRDVGPGAIRFCRCVGCLPHTFRVRTICLPRCLRGRSIQLAGHLQLVTMRLGDMVYEPGGQIDSIVHGRQHRLRCGTAERRLSGIRRILVR